MLHKLSTDENNALIQQLPQAVVFVDESLKIVYASDRWMFEFGLEQAQVIGQSIVTLLNLDKKLWAETIRKAFRDKKANQGLENFKDPKGGDYWFEWRHNPWYDVKGKPIGSIIEFINVSESIFNDIKIEQFEELLKESSENQKIGSWEYDAIKDQFNYCPISAEIFGSKQGDDSGLDAKINFFKEGHSRNRLLKVLENAKIKGVPWNESLIVVNTNGDEIPVETIGKPVFKGQEFLGYIGTISDISERLIQEKNNETKEHIFQGIFHSSYQFTGIIDLDGTFLEINDTALNFAKLKREDIVGKKFWDAYWWPIPPEILGGLKLMIAKAASGEIMRTEIAAMDREKKPVPVDFSLKPILDDQGRVISILAEGRMIVEMVKAREELRMNERQFRALYELSPVGYVLSQFGSGLILDLNPAFCNMTGFCKSEIGSLKYADIMQISNTDWPPEFLKELKENGVFEPVKHTLFRKNGTPYPALISGSIITNHRNKKFVWTVIQDLSEITSKDKQLEEERILLRTLIDNLPLNVFVKDRESRKLLANKSEIKYSGFSEESQILGKTDFELFPQETAQISREEDLHIINTSESMIQKETTHTREDGSTTHFITSKIPLKDKNGQITGLIGLSMDISDIKQKEAELNDLIEITSDQNKKLTTFAHIVSHDLRSHTANFSMLLDFLSKESDVVERQRIISMLNDASDNLLDTLTSLNEVVEITTNVNIEKKRLPLFQRINSAAQNLGGLIKQHNTKIIIDVPESATVRAISAYLDSILVNFITNAIKYRNPDRQPVIEMSLTTEGFYKVLHIKDNGLGIDMEKYGSKIFGMYKTFHNNYDARGIGLYLTKNQIEAMNGKVTVESAVGEGTLFKVYFNEKN